MGNVFIVYESFMVFVCLILGCVYFFVKNVCGPLRIHENCLFVVHGRQLGLLVPFSVSISAGKGSFLHTVRP